MSLWLVVVPLLLQLHALVLWPCGLAFFCCRAAAAPRAEVGPVASFRHCFAVAALPKTRSGKTLRRTIKAILEGNHDDPPVTRERARKSGAY